ncbi:MAG: 6-phosphofructokinase [Candidatus Bathyarchaeia archaeon]|nr:6-phosphofructokinase [Candidatus Bathyarchaeota archaeon]
MRLVAVATTGGDAPGMNAAVRSVVRAGISMGLKVIGFTRGYAGILAGESMPLEKRSVGGIIHEGGTFLKTSRADEMRTEEGLRRASEVLKDKGVDGLVVIGGNGSFRAACDLYEVSDIPVIGIPATIDNDLAGTDTTIGFDTAVNTALDAIDKIRDTATSHERVFVVEVMGRDRGFLALEVGIGAGAEIILVPEIECDIGEVCARLMESHRKGKKSAIIVMAEGVGDCAEITRSIRESTGFEVRLARLGHVQRGGRPTAYSRLLASRMGAASIEYLLSGERKTMTGIQGGKIVPVDLEYATETYKPIDENLYRLAVMLAT